MSFSDGGMKLRLDMKLSQKLVMTPQLQMAIKLLQLSRLELDEVVTQEMVENPLLEEQETEPTSSEELQSEVSGPEVERTEGDLEASAKKDEIDAKWEEYYLDDSGDEGWRASNVSPDDERPSYEQTLAKTTSLVDHLLWQLGLSAISEKEKEIGTAIIGEIEENGYLKTPLEEIAILVDVSVTSVEAILKVVQGFDPVGVAAKDLEECLLIQVAQLDLSGSLVESMIKNHLVDLEKKRYQNIAKACDATVEAVVEASKIIEHLEPKPGRPFFSSENVYITPDLHIVKSEGHYIVAMNDDGMPKLKISPFYRSLLRSKGEVTAKTKSYLEEKFRSALWLVRSIEQRNRTIQLVGESILKFQYEFMEKGVSHLKPLILRQVADDIEMHESTVSRVTTNKYMYTPQGIYELKFFFNGSLPRVGSQSESLSSIAVREMIRKMVDSEDSTRPLKDQEIVTRLKDADIEIARRTVSKYRAWLKIPPASRRKRPF
ncbi:MAG: RNA polymerase factor sigma-54 [Nitrospirae bacterium]|nr:RNA polymerase factor sigma-54 [Candidatus Manganitrophaceae bacterium]